MMAWLPDLVAGLYLYSCVLTACAVGPAGWGSDLDWIKATLAVCGLVWWGLMLIALGDVLPKNPFRSSNPKPSDVDDLKSHEVPEEQVQTVAH